MELFGLKKYLKCRTPALCRRAYKCPGQGFRPAQSEGKFRLPDTKVMDEEAK